MVAAVRSVAMRVLRTLGVLFVGFYAGFIAAAALLKRVLRSRGGEDSDEVALVAIFGGSELKSRAQSFRGGLMLAWYGGVAVDLREAQLGPDARLSIGALYGGVAIKVPPGWRVEHTARVFSGGVDVDVPEPDDPGAPTLVVEATVAFGGVSIKARAADAAEA
jgi:hypothetical protein